MEVKNPAVSLYPQLREKQTPVKITGNFYQKKFGDIKKLTTFAIPYKKEGIELKSRKLTLKKSLKIFAKKYGDKKKSRTFGYDFRRKDRKTN